MRDPERTIGVLTASASNSAERELLRGVISQAQANGAHTAVFSNIYNFGEHSMEIMSEHHIYELIRSQDIDGLIVITESFADVQLKQMLGKLLSTLTIPIIAVGAKLPEFSGVNCHYLNTDDAQDLQKLTLHLIEAHGFRTIDLLTGQRDSEIALLRQQGYETALASHGIPIDENRIHYGNFWLDSGRALAGRYVSGELPLPEAILCANCHMAFGILDVFAHSGIRVPEQVTVVSYEYSDERVQYTPLLTSLRRGREELGRCAADAMLARLHGRELPTFTPPEGELVCGKSCTCGVDEMHYLADLEQAQRQHGQNFFTVFNTMEQRLVDCRNLDEFTRVVGEYQWMIRDAEAVYLCLFRDWYDSEESAPDRVVCRCLTTWLDNTPFETDRLEFRRLFRMTDTPAAFYFVPVFFRMHLMGHIVLRFGNTAGYDSFLHYWAKTVSLALEYLRMKNDLRYLLRCQNLSETRDSLTDLYTEQGLRYVYNAMGEISGKECVMLVVRVCQFGDVLGTRQEQRVERMQKIAGMLRKLCGTHHIAGRTGEDTFVCLFQKGEPERLRDAAVSLLLQEDYIAEYGTDSFACTAQKCAGRGFGAVYEACCAGAEESLAALRKRRENYHFHQLSPIRDAIYLAPLTTFDPAELPEALAQDKDTFRHIYKKCFGISFHKDRIRARIAKTKQLLLLTDLNTTEIAEQCGYSDSKYFLHQFVKETGVTPIGYRKLFVE